MYARVLVALSEGSRDQTTREALRLARDPGVALRFVHVLDVRVNAAEGLNLEAVYAARARDGRKLLERALALAVESGVAADHALLDAEGRPVSAVLHDEVRRWNADLLVMGSRPRGFLSRLLGDDICGAVLRRTPIAILLIGVMGTQAAVS